MTRVHLSAISDAIGLIQSEESDKVQRLFFSFMDSTFITKYLAACPLTCYDTEMCCLQCVFNRPSSLFDRLGLDSETSELSHCLVTASVSILVSLVLSKEQFGDTG